MYIALGGAVAALREEFPYPVEDLDGADKSQLDIVARGAKIAIRRAQASLRADLRSIAELAPGEDQGRSQQ